MVLTRAVRTAFAILAFAGFSTLASSAQTAPTVFDVTSVKPNHSGSKFISNFFAPTRTSFTNMPVEQLLKFAFNVTGDRILGAPAWIRIDSFDVVGTSAPPLPPANRHSFDALRAMMRGLLETRFALRVHRETRELPVYLLVRANSDGRLGPNLKPTTVDCTARSPSSPSPCSLRTGGALIESIGTDWLFLNLGSQLNLDRPVEDKTGLTGPFDLKLEWEPNPQPGTDRPSVFTAVQEQLGLKLEPTRAPIEVLVIDSVERPTED